MTVDQNSIVGLYVIYFNRSPDPAGLTFWQSQDVTIEEMAAQFGASPEAKSLYPFLASPTLGDPVAFINEIYQNAFGRDADDAGLEYWLGVLEQDSSPEAVAEFVLAVAQGAQGTDFDTLQNRADIALQFTQDFVNAGIAFTSSVLTTSSQIIDTVTFTDESVADAEAAIDQAIIDIIGGGTGTTFTLLEQGAVLTAAASTHVSPADKFLSTANDQINGTVFLDGSVIQDPSTSDNDVLTATILPDVFDFQTIPFISKIEDIKLTGSPGGVVDIANITDVKTLEFVTGNITVLTSEKHPLNLAEGYAGTLTVLQTNQNSQTTINLNGTVAGTRIVDGLVDNLIIKDTRFKNNASQINIVVKADSVLKASDTTTNPTIRDTQTGENTNFVISGDKNLTIEGAVQMALKNSTAQLDATALTGKLTLNLANILSTEVDPFSVKQIVGGKSDDSFTLTAITNQLVGVAINGSDGEDTITASLGDKTSILALDRVTNVETVIVKQTSFVNTVLNPNDSFVASGKSATVDASSFTVSKLTYDGSLETNGTLNIIGGALNDTLEGGAKNDTLTGGASADTLTGGPGTGNDTFVYKSIADSNFDSTIAFDTITDFQVAGDVLNLKAVGFTSTQFLDTFEAKQDTLLDAAKAVSSNIGKNALAAFTYTGAEDLFKDNTFVLGTNNSAIDVVDAGDLFIQLDKALFLTSVNFA
jgi:Ca2+-binding RTX toxin-like protein